MVTELLSGFTIGPGPNPITVGGGVRQVGGSGSDGGESILGASTPIPAGGGGGTDGVNSGIGRDGGSGGGGGHNGSAYGEAGGDGNTPPTSPPQGNPGTHANDSSGCGKRW